MQESISDNQSKYASRRRLSWGARLGLIFFGLFLTCIMLEVGLRVVASVKARRARGSVKVRGFMGDQYWAIHDPDLGYRMNPHYGDLNSDGLRDHPIGPKAGRFRLLFLGDSIAHYGDNVDDTFVGHLRADLRRRHELQTIDVINAGIPGYTNYQEVLYLKKYGLGFQPDLVGVQFCLNDLHKFLRSFRIENGEIVPETWEYTEEARSNQRSRPRRLIERSYLWLWANNNLPIASKAAAWIYNDGFLFDYMVDINTAWRDESWRNIDSQLEEMVALGREHHFNLFLVIVPIAMQYKAYYLERDRDYVLKPQYKLREICERLGIVFYDLYPDLKASHFLETDGIHLTKEGREVVGRRLADFLSQSQLLPK